MKLKEAWSLLRNTGGEWWGDHAPRFSAALSFYTLLSLAPILLITLAIVGLVVGGEESARTAIEDQARDMMGGTAADAVGEVLDSAERPGAGIFSLVVGVVVLIVGATGVFGQLQTALNTMWEVRPKPGQGVWGMVRSRLLSFTAVMGVGFVLLVSLAVSAGLAALSDTLRENLPFGGYVLRLIEFGVSIGILTLMFALAFKILPDVEVRWSDVWIGALGTAVLFSVGKYLIGLYLGQSSTSSSYGAAASLVVLLIWVYYSAQIFFFGAEFTQVYANRYGGGIVPAENAERLPESRKGASLQAGGAREPAEEKREEPPSGERERRAA
jgi:membrane protein